MKSVFKKKLFQAGTICMLLGLVSSMIAINLISADSVFVTATGIKSLNVFDIITYIFLASSIIFFLLTILKKD